MNFLKLTQEKLPIEEICDLVKSPSCGAISLFVGTTRDNFDGKTVVTLEYEAYQSMCLKALEDICSEIRKQWVSVENIAIYHRLGNVPVKEASIVIAISSPHREDAIKATDWCINKVKSSVPIWKKEVYADSEPQWKENKESLPETLPYPPKRRVFVPKIEQNKESKNLLPHFITNRIPEDEMKKRLESLTKQKRKEIDENNIREFCTYNREPENSCSRVYAVIHKKKGSTSHLPVNHILNSYQYRDQTNSEYMQKYIPKNGIEERLTSLEVQLSLYTPIPRNVYKRLRCLEDRMLHLEALSPEYLQFWDRGPLKRKKKTIFSFEEIDAAYAIIEKEEDKVP